MGEVSYNWIGTDGFEVKSETERFSPFLRYRGNCDSRKRPEKFRDCRETGPRPGLLEAWLALTGVKYRGNLQVFTLLNQRFTLIRLRETGPRGKVVGTIIF